MPYVTVDDLPESLRHRLPLHAQEIYVSAFNHAWERYAGDVEQEAIAHRIAWAAVKRRYRKVGETWVEDGSRPAR